MLWSFFFWDDVYFFWRNTSHFRESFPYLFFPSFLEQFWKKEQSTFQVLGSSEVTFVFQKKIFSFLLFFQFLDLFLLKIFSTFSFHHFLSGRSSCVHFSQLLFIYLQHSFVQYFGGKQCLIGFFR